VGSGDDRLSRDCTIMGLAGLTAVFGMGTGGAPPVSSPESGRGAVRPPRPRWVRGEVTRGKLVPRRRWRVHPRRGPRTGRGRRQVGIVGLRPGSGRRHFDGGGRSGWSSRSAVRTGRLRRSPAVHSRPIDLVVFQEPSDPDGSWKPRLEEGFALRCLQRLSFPDLATRRCPERDSRHTRGRSSPILSY
jgi:hypothetical protein